MRRLDYLLVCGSLCLGAWLAAAPVGAQDAAEQQRVSQLLKRIDANGNGSLEPQEVPSQYKSIIDRAAREAGMDAGRPLRIDRLVQASAGQSGDGDRGDRGPRGSFGDRGPGGDRGSGGDRGPGGGDRGSRWGGGPPPWGGGGPGGGGPGGGGPGGSEEDRRRFFERMREERDRGRDNERRDGGRDNRNSSATSAAATAGAGFAVDPKSSALAVPPGFDLKTVDGLPLEERYEANLLRYVDREILGQHDRNGNGILDAEEWDRVQWADSPKPDDKDKDGRLTRAELAARMARVWGYGEKRPGGSGSPGAKGRGPWDDGNNSQKGGGGDYADGLMKQYDRNRDAILDKEEWSQMRGNWEVADRDRDGKLTKSEIQMHASAGNGNGDGNGQNPTGDKQGSFKQRTAQQRLPKGIPDWFVKKDFDADGQVAMSEWTNTWNDSELTEYLKFDLNNDGYITPEETLKPRDKSKFSVAETSPGGSTSRLSVGRSGETTARFSAPVLVRGEQGSEAEIAEIFLDSGAAQGNPRGRGGPGGGPGGDDNGGWSRSKSFEGRGGPRGGDRGGESRDENGGGRGGRGFRMKVQQE